MRDKIPESCATGRGINNFNNLKRKAFVAFFIFHQTTITKKSISEDMLNWKTGNDLCSRPVSERVFSALKVLTSVFGMRTGVTLSLKSPVMVECLIKYTHNYIFLIINK